ncbi:OsmC family protein [Flindersiella endophytica]
MLRPETKQTLRDALVKPPEAVDVTFAEGEAYDIEVRGHRLRVDQPRYQGTDSAPTPVELFVASLASCAAYYAGRYLVRHNYPRAGLSVRGEFTMAETGPARIESVRLTVRLARDLPPERVNALRAVVSHCTVHNSLRTTPQVDIEISTSTS